MHYVEAKVILSNKNGMNIYRGCSHGCIYCDSRSKCYNMNHDFTDIEVKENSLKLLEEALVKKRNKCMIAIGSMSDPYISLEDDLFYTQNALKLAYKYKFGFTLQTKSNLILRDLELLKKINEQTKVVIQMTLTTYDDKLCKIIEPNVCVTSKRFEVLKKLNENGIKTIVWICPILPFINDTKENLLGLIDYCVKAKVYGIIFFGFGLTLREGNREYFYEQLDKHFPGLKERYINTYHNSYSVESKNSKELYKILKEECMKNNIIFDNDYLFKYLSTYENKIKQLEFDLD